MLGYLRLYKAIDCEANMIEIFQPVKKDYSKTIGLNKKGCCT